MEWTDRIVGGFARVLNVVSAVWLASIALLILYDVVGREAFGTPFYGTNEIVSNSVLSIRTLVVFVSIFGVAVCALLTFKALTRPDEFIRQGSSDGA